MKLFTIVLGWSFLSGSAFAEKNNCRFVAEPDSVKVSWTAYKTTDKVAVQGTFPELKIISPLHGAKNLKALLAQMKAMGEIDSEKKSETGNPARDLTLYQKFFSMVASKGKLRGDISLVSGSDQKGKFQLSIQFNGKQKKLPMNYTLGADGTFEATGEFDMNDLGLGKALESLHQACEALHKGKDGVSKTWPNVGVKIAAKITQDCGKK